MGCAKRGAANGQTPLASRATKQTARKGAPDSDSRSVEREGAQAATRNTVKRGAHAAAPAPQASLTVSRQPSFRVAVKCGVCVVALLGFVVQATTFVARLASIRILPATQSVEDLIRGSLVLPAASLRRRLASLVYEALLLAAVLWAAGALFTLIVPDATSPLPRALLRAFLLAVAFAYFAWCWTRGGQTLAMKTWRIRVLSTSGLPLTLKQALLRFVLAVLGIGLAGCGLLWAWFDRDRQFLHDRLAGTRIVKS